jgi:hypothetical protein
MHGLKLTLVFHIPLSLLLMPPSNKDMSDNRVLMP